MSDCVAYTIDDIVEAIRRRDCVVPEATIGVGSMLFYIHMAYALGMGLQPSPLYARLAELERASGKPLNGADGMAIPPVEMP